MKKTFQPIFRNFASTSSDSRRGGTLFIGSLHEECLSHHASFARLFATYSIQDEDRFDFIHLTMKSGVLAIMIIVLALWERTIGASPSSLREIIIPLLAERITGRSYLLSLWRRLYVLKWTTMSHRRVSMSECNY